MQEGFEGPAGPVETQHSAGYAENGGLVVYHTGWQRCSSGHSFGPAVREHCLIHYVAGGKGVYVRGGDTHEVAKGQGFLILPGETTFYQADAVEPWEYHWVGFGGMDARSLLSRAGLDEERLVFAYDDVQGLFSRMHAPGRQGEAGEFAALGYLYLFLAEMMAVNTDLLHGMSIGEDHCRKAARYIRNNFSYPLTVCDVADYVGVDRTYLFRVFKKHLGISPQKYITWRRIKRAKELLRLSALSVKEIAFSCGFQDFAHFTRTFKQETGSTPSQFRAAEMKEKKNFR